MSERFKQAEEAVSQLLRSQRFVRLLAKRLQQHPRGDLLCLMLGVVEPGHTFATSPSGVISDKAEDNNA